MSRKLLRLAGCAALALGLAGAPAASVAQTPAGDSVTGVVSNGFGRDFLQFTFDAHSGPSGENPTGIVSFDSLFGNSGPLEVGCLRVAGKRASMVALAPNNSGIAGLLISVEDSGPGPGGEKLDWQTISSLPPDCPVPAEIFGGTESGDIVVTDAPPPPTAYAQCRQAGWVKYGFTSHAACNGYVHERARQACIFERVAHGIGAFRAKYGLPPDQDHAMRHCVRLYTGF
jgi:hypothetical protein